MTSDSHQKVLDPIILGNDFDLAFKLVFFDENDREVEPAQYKALSTFSVERLTLLASFAKINQCTKLV